MPDLDERHSNPGTNGPPPGGSAAAGASRAAAAQQQFEDDPLSKLHRMSRTAGLGAQDYVAINPTAVVALILGFASALALLFSVLLIVPVAGVICALVALWQIHDSNGTQTGRGLAWTGLLLSVGFAGVVGVNSFLEDRRNESERQAVTRVVEEFGRRLMAEDFAGAYAMTGGRFQERVPEEEFAEQFRLRFAHPSHGKITSFTSNERVFFEPGEDMQNAFATTVAVILLPGGREDRQQIGLAMENGKWVIEGFGWFPPRPTPLER